MRFLLLVIILGFAGQAYADGFGQRFGNEPPFALRDTLDPSTVIYIEPSAGGDDEAAEEPGDQAAAEDTETGRVYPSEGESVEVRPSSQDN